MIPGSLFRGSSPATYLLFDSVPEFEGSKRDPEIYFAAAVTRICRITSDNSFNFGMPPPDFIRYLSVCDIVDRY